MIQILYNLRSDGDQWRITKFTDGEVESSYLTSDQACDCPAGHRPTCRHRQMLPQMLARHLANSDLFWDFDRGFSCDINGNAKRETVACAPAEQDTEGHGWFKLTGDSRLDHCDSEGCGGQPTWRLEANGVGSNYCSGCRTKIIAVPAGQHTAAEAKRQAITDIDGIVKWIKPEQTVRTTPAWRRL